MKSIIFSLLAASLLVFSSCDKDDDCNSESLATTIVGTWEVRVLGINTGDVEFRANGDLIDNSDALVGGEIGGETFDDKSYVVNSDSQFTARAENANGSIESDFDVTSFDCDEINIDFSGFAVTLTRK